MKKLLGAIAILLILSVPASAAYRHHWYFKAHPHYPKPPADPKGSGNAGGAWCTGGCVWVGGFIVAIGTAIVLHEIMGPACAKPGLKNGYDSPTFWRPLCNWKDPISVRG